MSLESRMIVIAYPDGEYIKGFEEELMKRLEDDVRIYVITETDFLMEFFSSRKTVDALIIAQEFIGNYLQEHDIMNLMILDSSQTMVLADDDSESRIRQYMGQEDILRFIDRCFSGLDEPDDEFEHPEETDDAPVKVVTVYSPIGGSGKSLTALALGKKLRMLEEKVLVIGCDSLQSIGVFLESRKFADEVLADLLKEPSEETYWTILKNITQDSVPCLLPFEKPLPSLGIAADELLNLVSILKQKKDFSYLILDLGTTLTNVVTSLIDVSDICVIVTEPNVDAARKLEKIHRNQDMLPDANYVTLVNQYHSDGLQLSPDNVFGSFRAYQTAAEAMEDPVFYRLAMKVSGENEF